MKTLVKILVVVLIITTMVVGYNYLTTATSETTTTSEGYAFSFENGTAKFDINNKNNNIFSNTIQREEIEAGKIYEVITITTSNCFTSKTETVLKEIKDVKISQSFKNNSLAVVGGVLPYVSYTDKEGETYAFYKNF
jgi:hypothetical protein